MESVLIFGVCLVLGLFGLFIVSPLIIAFLFLVEGLATAFMPPMTKKEVAAAEERQRTDPWS